MTTLSLFSLLEEQVAPEASGLTNEQRKAVERRDGPLFVHAGAGTGKTRVLVERFVRAVLEDEVGVERMLAITFTEKAAAELRTRIRARFVDAGERDHARAVDSAWISTIHGFCSRLLRANALSAGLDPEYRVLAEHEAERIAAHAFDSALEDFLGPPEDARRVELVAAHGPDRLAGALRTVHAQMRGRGRREPALPRPPRPPADQLRQAHERLAGAVRTGSQSLAAEAEPVAQVRAAVDRLDRCAGALDRLEPDGLLDPLELAGLGVRRGNARALRGAVFDELEEAHAACLELCGRTRALDDLWLVDELLRLYGRRYAQLKTERSALDFDDLELLARDLLRGRPGLRERTRERFDHVLVDELQDTNRLQSEIVDLVADGNLFTVGDELQSIYGFRGADVGVFAERRRAAVTTGREVRLSASFRARAEILDVLNAAFEASFGEGFTPLHAAAQGGTAPRVELLAVDRDNGRWAEALGSENDPFGAAMHGAPAWRAAEARLLAGRVDELLARGDFAPAEVALLLRSWTDVNRYEQALAERGLPTYVAGGGGYWSAQQVCDLRAYLATLANPRDEEALISVLASPFVGASLDALALLRLQAGRGRPLWSALERGFGTHDDHGEASALASAVPEADRDRLRGFVRRLTDERREAPRRSLPDLVERAVTASGYDRAVLALPGGERRMANVRKLKRLAREFEAAEGRDLRGFLDSIDRRGVAAVREGEAPLEGEGIEAVRLMTIHAAKGLEFPLVCVGDLGRGELGDTPLLRVSADGRVGLRLPDPDGGALDALDARALAEEAARAERAEERRLLWVAATRAEQRLIVSGALDLESARSTGRAPAMDWLAPALVPELRQAHRSGEREGRCVRSWEGRQAAVAWRVLSPANLGEVLPPADRVPLEATRAPAGRPVGPAPGASRADPNTASPMHEASPGTPGTPGTPRTPGSTDGVPHPLGQARPRALAAPGADQVTRISYSALESYRRCGYRFYLERRLRLCPEGEPTGAAHSTPREGAASALSALTRGSVAHELLERSDPRRPVAPRAEHVAARLRAGGAAATEGEVDELTRLVGGFLGSPLSARMARARTLRRELPFTFPFEIEAAEGSARSVLVEGVIDAYCAEGPSALVVDYKTDRISPGVDLEALCAEAYATQRLVYALAGLRGGADRVEVAHVFLDRPHEPVFAAYEASDSGRLETRLGALVGELVAGQHEPSATPGTDLCRGCPGRAALCSWPPERTGARLAAA